MDHQILSKTTVYQAHAFSVEDLRVKLPDERETTFNLVRHNDSVTILPLDSDGNIWFVTQYRMGCERILLELPAGVMNDGETALESAQREVREETGMAAGQMEHLGSVYLAPGYSSELNHIFLATEIYPSPLEMDDDEFLHVEKYPAEEALLLAQQARLQDSKSLAALYLASGKLSNLSG
ncbi:MAG: ADP-ribose pyrophosphatase [Chloroflexota bacterium]|nr:ADP-ribose pyrophosphatase [Chloroflexota bacterium]